MNMIMNGIFGSHLYGTSTENSDRDYKGIYIPTKEECYLNSIIKSINRKTRENTNSKNTLCGSCVIL